MPFRYRLQTLLEQKRREKDEAQQTLATAQRLLRAEEEELQHCRREQVRAAEDLRNAQAELISGEGRSSGNWIQLRRDYLEQLKDRRYEALDTTRLQQEAVREAEESLQKSRADLAARSRDVETLEKHRARAERKFITEADRKETLEQEEMANILFLDGRRKT